MSVSSYASSTAETSVVGGLRPTSLTPDGDGETFEDPHTLQLGIFGVLYTVSKEKQLTSVKFAFFRLFLDFLQLWLLVVNPSYGWAINAKDKVWQAVSFIQLNTFLTDRGYTFFLAFLYVFIALLWVNLALSVWVARAFSNNRFEHVWPIQFLRWFGLIFYQVLDIATLTLLLVTLDCNYFNVPSELRYHNQEFPDVMCWSMPHIIHITVSVASIVMFVFMATSQVVSEMELNPLTRNYMAIAHTHVEGMGFAIKTVVTIASVTIGTSAQALSVVYLIFFGVLFYLAVRWVPYVYSALNYVRCASYGTVLYSSVLLVVLAFGETTGSSDERRTFQKRVTFALWAGMGPAAAAGALACHMRLRHFSKHVIDRFRNAEVGAASKAIYRFNDAREVEIAARACRKWIDEDTLEPAAVGVTEHIIKAGMLQLPQDPQMIILYSSFLIDVQGSYQSGYAQLQTAKKQSPGLLERFAIFSREQEHTQKSSGANGGGFDGAVDLVSYVKFQRNHRVVVRAHREALMAMRSFWGLLLRHHVNFNHLSKALHRIEVSVKAAERAYRGVLSQHSSSARLIRLYGRFLETVKFDPWAASKWYSEADRLEEEAEHTKEALQLGGMENLLPQGAGAERGVAAMEGVAFICINAQSIIQVASPEASAMLGYSKNELKGKDVGIIIPPPFGDRHTAYVRNYIQNGTAPLLDRTSEMVAVTKSRQVLAVRLRVTKISGLNEDSIFMGVIETLPPTPDEARAWVLGNGTLIAADDRFCDWLGYEGIELPGLGVESLLLEPETMQEALKVLSRTNTAAAVAPNSRLVHRRTSMLAGEQMADKHDIKHDGKHDGKGDGKGSGEKASGYGGGTDGKVTWLRHSSNSIDQSGLSGVAAMLSHAMHASERAGGKESFLSGAGAAASGMAAGGLAGAAASGGTSPVVLPRTVWRHKYSAPLAFDTVVLPGAFGSLKVPSIVIRRCAPPAASGAKAALGGVACAMSSGLSRGLSGEPCDYPDSAASPHFLRRGPASAGAVPRVAPSLRYDDMLLVCDIKGHVLHVTAALAEALGRSAESIRAGGLGLLIPEPASILHAPWLQDLGNPMSNGTSSVAPAYSCRSGLAVSLSTYSEQHGPGLKPFRLNVTQRLAEGGGSKIHVVSVAPLTLDQALSERRLRLSVDLYGTILSADEATPPELFGADPRVLPGRSVSQLIDLFRPDALDEMMLGAYMPAAASPDLAMGGFGLNVRAAAAGGDAVEGADAVARAVASRRLTKALLELARRSTGSPGCSWRVGVQTLPDEQAQQGLEQLADLLGPDSQDLATQFLGAKTVPAVMRVRLVKRQFPPPMPISQALSTRVPVRTDVANSNGPWQPSSQNVPRQLAGVAAPGLPTGQRASLLAGVPIAEATVEDIEDFKEAQAIEPARMAWRAPYVAKRRDAGPVAEGMEPAAERQGSARYMLDEKAVAALDELAEAIVAPPHLPPPAAAASAGAAALAAAVAAAAERSSRRASTNSDRSQLAPASRMQTQQRASGAMPSPLPLQSPMLPPPPQQLNAAEPVASAPPGFVEEPPSLAAAATPKPSAAPQPVSPPPVSPPPTGRISRMILQACGDAPKSEPAPRVLRPASAHHTPKPVSLRLPPDRCTDTAPRMVPPAAEALGMGLAPGLVLEIELWRADLLSGVLEVDERGRVLRADGNCPMANTGLVLGAAPGSLANASVSDFVPLPPGGVAALLDSAPGEPGAVRGALKKRVTKQAKAGAPTLLAARHLSDGCELALTVQAVRRAGPSGSAFLILRANEPTTAQPGFMRWLYHGDTSQLMPPQLDLHGGKPRALSRVASMEYVRAPAARSSLTNGSDGGGAAAVVAAAALGAQASMARRASTFTGIAPMPMHSPFITSNAAGNAAAAGIPHSFSVMSISAIDARLVSQSGSQQVVAPMPLATPRVSTEASMSPMRIAAIRSAAATASAKDTVPVAAAMVSPVIGAQSRLVLGGTGGERPAAGATASTGDSSQVPYTADEQAVRPQRDAESSGAAAAVRSFPSQRNHSFRHQRWSNELVTDAEAAPAAVAALPTKASPRQGASLRQGPGEEEPSPMPPASSRLSPKRHNMVRSWVSSGHGHGLAEPSGLDAQVPPGAQGADAVDPLNVGSEGGGDDGETASGEGSSNDSGSEAGDRAAPSPTAVSERDGGTDPEVESEAGAVVANYSVGKRFKKLHKILMSPLAQQPARRLRLHAVGTVLVLLVAHTVTFALLLTQLMLQQEEVQDLNSAAVASLRVHEIATTGRVLDRLYAGNSFVEGSRDFGDPTESTLERNYADLKQLAFSLKELHHGVYRGFRSLRRIPADYGLRDIWDSKNINITLFYEAHNDTGDTGGVALSGDAPQPSHVLMGLWDAGNLYLTQTLDLYDQGPSFVRQGGNFSEWSTWKFIRANGLTVIFPAYQATLEALVQLTVAKSKSIYNLQLIVLCLEGGLMCCIACAYTWYAASKFSQRRYSLYGVFIQIPLGVTRGLANMSLKLEAAEDEEEDDGALHLHLHDPLHHGEHHTVLGAGLGEEGVLTDNAIKAAAHGHGMQAHSSIVPHLEHHASSRRHSGQHPHRNSLSFAVEGMPGAGGHVVEESGGGHGGFGGGGGRGGGGAADADGGHGGRGGGLRTALGSFAFWRGRAKVKPQAKLGGKTKRRLMPSQRLALSLVAPFVLWGIAIAAINLVGYHDLKAMTAFIATLNVVNDVLVRVNRVIYYVLEVAAAFTWDSCIFFKSILAAEMSALTSEYAAMLYGREAMPDSDSLHFQLAESGVAFGGFTKPGQLLYETTGCLCLNPEDCQPADSPLYQVTHNGLDVLLKNTLLSVDALVVNPVSASGLNSTEFKAVWATGHVDLANGMTRMSELFLDEVQGSYNKVVVQQIAMFAIGWVWGLFFLALQLRPLLRRTHSEMRRIAELLSQLPGEVDCEALVTAVILGEQGNAMPAGAGRPGGAGGPTATGNVNGGGSAAGNKPGNTASGRRTSALQIGEGAKQAAVAAQAS